MTVRVASLPYVIALTAPERRHVVPQMTIEARAKRIREDIERRVRNSRDGLEADVPTPLHGSPANARGQEPSARCPRLWLEDWPHRQALDLHR